MSGNGLLCSRRRANSFPLKTVYYYYCYFSYRVGKPQSAVWCKTKCLHSIQITRSFEKYCPKRLSSNIIIIVSWIIYIYIKIIYAFTNIPLDYFNWNWVVFFYPGLKANIIDIENNEEKTFGPIDKNALIKSYIVVRLDIIYMYNDRF